MTGVVTSVLLVLAAAVTTVSRRSRIRLARLTGRRPAVPDAVARLRRGLLAQAEVSRRLVVAGTAGTAAVIALVGYGPVAGFVAGAYAGAASHAMLKRRVAAAERRAQTSALDGVAGLVADLRAGVTPGSALSAAMPLLIGAPARHGAATVDDLGGHLDTSPRGRVLRRLTAGWRLAESTGAPLADVLDRLDAEVRGGERARGLAAAHAASARATATLLAGLPLAGVVLGYGIGADPVAVLFGTPIGGGCAVAAVTLQLAGLAWARRLAHIDPERVELPEPAR